MWLNQFKIAIIEKNLKKLNELMDKLPQFEKQEDIETAIYLLSEASTIFTELRDETKSSMVQIKKNIDFMQSTEAPLTASLDITS